MTKRQALQSAGTPRTLCALAGIAATLLAVATCHPAPAPAEQAGEEPPAAAADADGQESDQDAESSAKPEDSSAGTPNDPQGLDPAAAETPPQQDAQPPAAAEETYPDMTRALETGMPACDGVSANPADVLLQVAVLAYDNGLSPQVAGVDESTGRVIYL